MMQDIRINKNTSKRPVRFAQAVTLMKQFLFVFEYCRPKKQANSEEASAYDESGYAFIIQAESYEQALAWGRDVSEKFVEFLFQSESPAAAPPKWREIGFDHWVEPDPLARYSGRAVEALPVITAGELPRFEEWVEATEKFGLRAVGKMLTP